MLELAEPLGLVDALELVLEPVPALSPLALGVVDELLVDPAPALAGALLEEEALDASTFSLSFTLVTPGMASAACTARLRSSSEATLPFSFTSPLSLALTSMFAKAGSVPSWSFTFVFRASASTFASDFAWVPDCGCWEGEEVWSVAGGFD